MKVIVCLFLLGLGELSSTSPIDDKFGRISSVNYEPVPAEANVKKAESVFSGIGLLVAGGVEADKNEFPWLVNIVANNTRFGGTIIAEDLIVTSAGALIRTLGPQPPASKISVTAGEHNLRIVEGTEQIRGAIGVKVHESYSQTTNFNDIALIWLNQSLIMNQYVKPLALPSGSSQTGTIGRLAGWGDTDADGTRSQVVNKVDIPIAKDCTVTNPSGRFCAGELGSGACAGDTGDALICNINRNPYVCGVYSTRVGECGGAYGIYTNVSAYLSWIEENGGPKPITTTTKASTTTRRTTTTSTTEPTTSETEPSNPSSPSTNATVSTSTSSESPSSNPPPTTICIPNTDPTTDSATGLTSDPTTDSASSTTDCVDIPPITTPSSTTMILVSRFLLLFTVVTNAMYFHSH